MIGLGALISSFVASILMSIPVPTVAQGPVFSHPLATIGYGQVKVTICHKDKNTLSVSVNAVTAHMAHGDQLGACDNGGPSNN